MTGGREDGYESKGGYALDEVGASSSKEQTNQNHELHNLFIEYSSSGDEEDPPDGSDLISVPNEIGKSPRLGHVLHQPARDTQTIRSELDAFMMDLEESGLLNEADAPSSVPTSTSISSIEGKASESTGPALGLTGDTEEDARRQEASPGVVSSSTIVSSTARVLPSPLPSLEATRQTPKASQGIGKEAGDFGNSCTGGGSGDAKEQVLLGRVSRAPEWALCTDGPDGSRYYWNLVSGQVAWALPENLKGAEGDLIPVDEGVAAAHPSKSSNGGTIDVRNTLQPEALADAGIPASVSVTNRRDGDAEEMGRRVEEESESVAGPMSVLRSGSTVRDEQLSVGGDAGKGLVVVQEDAEDGGTCDNACGKRDVAQDMKGEIKQSLGGHVEDAEEADAHPVAEGPTGARGAGEKNLCILKGEEEEAVMAQKRWRSEAEYLRRRILVEPKTYVDQVFRSLRSEVEAAAPAGHSPLPLAQRLAVEAEIRHSDWTALAAMQRQAVAQLAKAGGTTAPHMEDAADVSGDCTSDPAGSCNRHNHKAEDLALTWRSYESYVMGRVKVLLEALPQVQAEGVAAQERNGKVGAASSRSKAPECPQPSSSSALGKGEDDDMDMDEDMDEDEDVDLDLDLEEYCYERHGNPNNSRSMSPVEDRKDSDGGTKLGGSGVGGGEGGGGSGACGPRRVDPEDGDDEEEEGEIPEGRESRGAVGASAASHISDLVAPAPGLPPGFEGYSRYRLPLVGYAPLSPPEASTSLPSLDVASSSVGGSASISTSVAQQQYAECARYYQTYCQYASYYYQQMAALAASDLLSTSCVTTSTPTAVTGAWETGAITLVAGTQLPPPPGQLLPGSAGYEALCYVNAYLSASGATATTVDAADPPPPGVSCLPGVSESIISPSSLPSGYPVASLRRKPVTVVISAAPTVISLVDDEHDYGSKKRRTDRGIVGGSDDEGRMNGDLAPPLPPDSPPPPPPLPPLPSSPPPLPSSPPPLPTSPAYDNDAKLNQELTTAAFPPTRTSHKGALSVRLAALAALKGKSLATDAGDTTAQPCSGGAPAAKTTAAAVPKPTRVKVGSQVRGAQSQSLFAKWGQARQELEEEEERKRLEAEQRALPSHVRQDLDRARRAEQWYQDQIRTGAARENPNFEPIAGDWRKRFSIRRKRADLEESASTTTAVGRETRTALSSAHPSPPSSSPLPSPSVENMHEKKADKKAGARAGAGASLPGAEVKTSSLPTKESLSLVTGVKKAVTSTNTKAGANVLPSSSALSSSSLAAASAAGTGYPTNSKARPDLLALSVGLPAGWRAMWDKASGDIYYGNLVTKKTKWTRPIEPKGSVP